MTLPPTIGSAEAGSHQNRGDGDGGEEQTRGERQERGCDKEVLRLGNYERALRQ